MVCGWPSRFEVAIVIRKTLHRIGIADVNPLRIFSRRDRTQSRTVVSDLIAKVDFCSGFPSLDAAKNRDLALSKSRPENIAVGRGQHLARLVQAGSIDIDFESGQSFRKGALWTRRRHGFIVCGFCRKRLRQIAGRDLMNFARTLSAVVVKRRRVPWAKSATFRTRAVRTQQNNVKNSMPSRFIFTLPMIFSLDK